MYRKPQARHATGGALSMLWHQTAGPLFAASLNKYEMVEAHNQQTDPDGKDFCLTPRVEWRKDSAWFTQIQDEKAESRVVAGEEIEFDVNARLTDAAQSDPPSGRLSARCNYRMNKSEVRIGIRMDGSAGDGALSLVLPLISRNDEKLQRESERCCSVLKPGGRVVVEADAPLAIAPTPSKDRVFNLVPGFEAVPFTVALAPREGHTEVRVRVERI
jgi:hypothetical protein